jgi:hypothetical protein
MNASSVRPGLLPEKASAVFIPDDAMNLTLHLVRYDLVRMRVWLIGWLVVLLLPIAAGTMLMVAGPVSAGRMPWQERLAILTGFQVLVGYILTLLVLQEHRLVGTSQFWLTRPIARGRLLASKLIGVTLMVALLPVLVSVPWWLWCGLGLAHMAQAAFEIVAVMMLVALLGGLMAVVTDSLARALLWTVVLVGVLLFVMLYFTVLNAATMRSGHDFSLMISRSIVAASAVALMAAGVVIAQFFLRRRGWWLGVAGAVTVVLLLFAFRWPRGWIPLDPVESNAAIADGVKLRFYRAYAGDPPRERRPGQEVFQAVHTQLIVSGVPAGFDAGGVGARQQWRSETGVVNRVERYWNTVFPRGSGRSEEDGDAETARWFAEKQRERARIPLAAGEMGLTVTSYLQPSMVARMQSQPPQYQARLWWQLARGQILFRIPLEPSRRLTSDGRSIRVVRVERGGNYLEVTTVETRPITLRSLLNDEAGRHAWYHRRGDDDAMLSQVHSGRPELVNGITADLDDPQRAVVNGVQISWRRRAPHGRQVIRDGKWQHLPPAVDGDTLSVMIWKEAALFSRVVNVERLELGPRP